jgi:hypothetical protein
MFAPQSRQRSFWSSSRGSDTAGVRMLISYAPDGGTVHGSRSSVAPLRAALSWYLGWLSVAWVFILVALISIFSSPVWAGTNCQPVPQPTSEKIAEVGIVVAFVATFGAGLAALSQKGTPSLERRLFVVTITLAAWVVLLMLGFHHSPSCPEV